MPTKELETVRSAVIAANPSIMDVVFGCELQRQDQYGHIYKCINEVGFANNDKRVWLNSIPFGTMEVEKERIGVDFFVLGRPIRLADVLLAIRGDKEKLMYEHLKPVVELLGQYWNFLKDDLTLQSPETISFLYQLLK